VLSVDHLLLEQVDIFADAKVELKKEILIGNWKKFLVELSIF
jgi:hypothetical protein